MIFTHENPQNMTVWAELLACCGCGAGRSKNNNNNHLFELPLSDAEREAVEELLGHLENRGDTDFYSGPPLEALTTLVESNNIDLQRSASLTFAEITEQDTREVDADALNPILQLLKSHDVEVQRAASAALGNLAVNDQNKVKIVQMGGLLPLIKQMNSPNVEIQCNAVGCITNLATADENKAIIAKSGALTPLTRLAKSKDMRVQRNATGALLNMTHSNDNRQELVIAGAIPVLVQLLSSPDVDVQYYSTTALSNIAVDPTSREKLSRTEPGLVKSLINLMDQDEPSDSRPSDSNHVGTNGSTDAAAAEAMAHKQAIRKVQCQAALALRNLASDEKYQLEIAKSGLRPLLKLLRSDYPPLYLSAVACIRNISIHPLNESPIIEEGFLKPLVTLLGTTDDEDTLCHAISTLRNLAASSDRNKELVLEAGAVKKCIELVLNAALAVQEEMTAAIAVLALSDDLKPRLIDLDVFDVLVPLTDSERVEVKGNSAAALGNLSSHVNDYSLFVKHWYEPNGGIRDYLHRFLQSGDSTFQHIAIWTLLQLLESDHADLIALIQQSPDITRIVTHISERSMAKDNESHESGDDGDSEVVGLARRCVDQMTPKFRDG